MPDYKEILYDKQRGGVLITLEPSRSAERDHPADVERDSSRAGRSRSRSGDPRHRHHRRRTRFQLRIRSGDDQRPAP